MAKAKHDFATLEGHRANPTYFTVRDDGTFILRDMPEGTMKVAVFRTGYDAVVIDRVILRAGEDFALREQSLLAATGTTAPGSLSGKVTLVPEGSAEDTVLVALNSTGASSSGAVAADGTFTVGGIEPGVYRVLATHEGYLPASVLNVLVNSGADSVVSEIILQEGSGGMGTMPTGGGGGSNDGGPICPQGLPCAPSLLCRDGAVDCQSGGPVCVEIGNAPDGTSCGSGLQCASGSCVALCVPGARCMPSMPCNVGITTCLNGIKGCTDTGASLPTGAHCGTDQVCAGGSCVACKANIPCTPSNSCHAGATM